MLMVRPAAFGSNAETAGTNAFQEAGECGSSVREGAQREFDGLVVALRGAGVRVVVVDDTRAPVKPDAVFPNNWVSFHGEGDGGRVVVYPMMAASRRAEVRWDVIDRVEAELGARWERVDLSGLAGRGAFCEGTGSLVLDRRARVAYAALSARTTRAGVDAVCEVLGYEAEVFRAVDRGGETYHTNVMMSVGDGVAVVCAESIVDAGERARVVGRLGEGGREVVEISPAQRDAFVGNVLFLRGVVGGVGGVVVMSARAESALGDDVGARVRAHARVVSAPLGVIERFGGGSARCMLCEVFPPR